jgi:hypothetical protein
MHKSQTTLESLTDILRRKTYETGRLLGVALDSKRKKRGLGSYLSINNGDKPMDSRSSMQKSNTTAAYHNYLQLEGSAKPYTSSQEG